MIGAGGVTSIGNTGVIEVVDLGAVPPGILSVDSEWAAATTGTGRGACRLASLVNQIEDSLREMRRAGG